ncbi:hypothetical protein FNYG_14984 [Fusarium nygamai]|uniref:Carbonic anhydrase n=1 Tax=Gibberella nygamai TaxID=42673 RepID=A0A2K0UN83_GIBNY|nr:hypothetical protein FNYG_14984 [Fusarium nygamai]
MIHIELSKWSHVTVLACMDARLDPAQFLGIELGSAHVIRNAGGRAADALRSIIISQQLLGTREIVVVHHTDCGMLTFSDMGLKAKLRKELDQDVDHMAFLTFGDLEQSVRDDVAFLKKSPLVLDVPITGLSTMSSLARSTRLTFRWTEGLR